MVICLPFAVQEEFKIIIEEIFNLLDPLFLKFLKGENYFIYMMTILSCVKILIVL